MFVPAVSLFRIVADVAGDVEEVIPIPDQAIEVIALPEWALTYAARGEAFPTGDDGFQWNVFFERKKEMHVIWRDGPCMDEITVVIKILKSISYDLSICGIF